MPKNKGHANFYECCDLMKKVYLQNTYQLYLPSISLKVVQKIGEENLLCGFDVKKETLHGNRIRIA